MLQIYTDVDAACANANADADDANVDAAAADDTKTCTKLTHCQIL